MLIGNTTLAMAAVSWRERLMMSSPYYSILIVYDPYAFMSVAKSFYALHVQEGQGIT